MLKFGRRKIFFRCSKHFAIFYVSESLNFLSNVSIFFRAWTTILAELRKKFWSYSFSALFSHFILLLALASAEKTVYSSLPETNCFFDSNNGIVASDELPLFFDSGPLVYGIPESALRQLKSKDQSVNLSVMSTTPKLKITAINHYVNFIIQNSFNFSITWESRNSSSTNELFNIVVSSLLRLFNKENAEVDSTKQVNCGSSWWQKFRTTFWSITITIHNVIQAIFQ